MVQLLGSCHLVGLTGASARDKFGIGSAGLLHRQVYNVISNHEDPGFGLTSLGGCCPFALVLITPN